MLRLKKLKQTDNLFPEDAFDVVNQIIIVLDLKGKLRLINKRGCKVLGVKRKSVLNRDWFNQFNVPEERNLLRRLFREAMTKEQLQESFENNVLCGKGRKKTMLWHSTLLRDNKGKPEALLCSGEDVSALREQDRKLRKSEENYRALVNNISQVVFDVTMREKDLKKSYPVKVFPSFASERALALTGYKAEAFISGKVIYQKRIHPDDRKEAIAAFWSMIKERKPVVRTYRLRHKNGSYKWIEDALIPRLDMAGKIAGWFGVLSEITERKSFETTIRDYEKFFELAHDLFCVSGADGRFKKVNSSFERILGYRAEELLGKSYENFTHPEDLKLSKGVRAKLRKGTPSVNVEGRFRCKDGSYKWISWSAHPAARRKLIFAVGRDISERKGIEDKIRENEAFLDSVVENIPNMIFVKDARELKFVRFNKAGEKLLGISRDKMLGKSDYDFFPEEEADFFTQKDREVLKSGKAADIPDEKIKTRAKGERLLHTKKIPLYDKEGKPEYLLGISEDITEKHQSMELLRKSELMLREAQEIANVGNWEFDVVTEGMNWSDETYRIFGLDAKKDKVTRELFRSRLHPDDIEVLNENVRLALQKGIPYEFEMRAKGRDGAVHHVLGRGKPVYENGKVVKLVGTCLDITGRKLAEAREMKAFVSGQDMERQRVAEDLHDSLGQKLSAIKLLSENIKWGESDDFRSKEEVIKFEQSLNEAIEEVRNISHNLMPSALADFGLPNALSQLCRKLDSANGTRVSFQEFDVQGKMDKSIEYGLYRIAQELLNNAIRHAQAQEIILQLFQRENKLILTAEDDGKGFNKKEKIFESRFGLNSITSRTKALNGIFILDSYPGRGTVASIEIPLKA